MRDLGFPRRLSACLAVLLASLGAGCAAKPDPAAGDAIRVNVTLAADRSDPHVLVHMVFPAQVETVRLIHQPQPPCVEPGYALVDVRRAAAHPEELEEGLVAVLRRTEPGEIDLTYRVTPPFHGYDFQIAAIAGCDPLIVTPNSFFFDAQGLFLAQALSASGQRLTIPGEAVFNGVPKGWAFTTSFEDSKTQHIRMANYHDLRGLFIMGGVIEETRTQASGLALSIVSPKEAPAFARDVRQGLVAALPYFAAKWGRLNGAHHNVFLMSTSAGGDSFAGGVGEMTTDAQYVVNATTAAAPDVVVASIHELAHQWITQARVYQDLDIVREGLTDYVARRAMIDLRLGSADALIDRANQAFANLALGHIPQFREYDAGLLLALALDADALASGGRKPGIDAAIRALIADKRAEVVEADYLRIARDAGLLPADAQLSAADVAPRCDLVIGGKRWRLFSGMWPGYLRAFKHGDDNVIHDVAPDSAAARAGLRNGQVLLDIVSGGNWNVTLPLQLKVRDGAEEKLITYAPLGPSEGKPYAQYLPDGAPPIPGAVVAPSKTCRPLL